MVTVFWGINGFYLIDALPEEDTFISAYACTLLKKLSKIIDPTHPKRGLRGVWFHCENARPHTSPMTRELLGSLGAHVIRHPPYYPDIATCDFFLFGYIKESLNGMRLDNPNDLTCMITDIVNQISPETRRAVFDNWMARLGTVIRSDGEYIP